MKRKNINNIKKIAICALSVCMTSGLFLPVSATELNNDITYEKTVDETFGANMYAHEGSYVSYGNGIYYDPIDGIYIDKAYEMQQEQSFCISKNGIGFKSVSFNSSDSLEIEAYKPCTVNAYENTMTYKGIQGKSNGDHYFTNVDISGAFLPDGVSGPNGFTPYTYQGKTYYFSNPVPENWVKSCNSAGKTVNVCFLLKGDGTRMRLYDPAAIAGGYLYYAPNFSTATVAKEYEAFFHFLAEKFSKEDCHIDNWILGNEENMPAMSANGTRYHITSSYYGADYSANTVTSKYAAYFNCVYDAVHAYTSATRVSASLDHSWQHNDEGRGISTKDFLNLFNSKVGGKNWYLSYHAYPAVLFETKIWAPVSDYTGTKLNPNDASAQFVDGANLGVMTSYIKSTFGAQHRVMLTEVGFSQNYGAQNQAACFAYTYYAAKYDDLVDCLIIHDANLGGKENFSFSTLMQQVYDRIDTGNATDAAWIQSVCCPVIGVGSFKNIIPGYHEDRNIDKEKIGAFVDRLYQQCLGRSADANGRNNWISKLCRGTASGTSAAQGFFFSAELTNKKLSDEQFVETLYRVMMNRSSDAAGKADWLYKLKNGVTREGVFNGFSGSTEFDNICNQYGISRGSITVGQARDRNPGLTTYVARLYTKALGRQYEVAGLNYWCDQILTGKYSIDAASTTGFFFSDEFQNKKMNNSDFVNTLYATFFDRKADTAGYNDWMGKLNSGVSRADVLKGFTQSQEFYNLKKSYGLVQ